MVEFYLLPLRGSVDGIIDQNIINIYRYLICVDFGPLLRVISPCIMSACFSLGLLHERRLAKLRVEELIKEDIRQLHFRLRKVYV